MFIYFCASKVKPSWYSSLVLSFKSSIKSVLYNSLYASLISSILTSLLDINILLRSCSLKLCNFSAKKEPELKLVHNKSEPILFPGFLENNKNEKIKVNIDEIEENRFEDKIVPEIINFIKVKN